MFINIGVSVLVIAIVLTMLLTPKPKSLLFSDSPGIKDRGFSNIFPKAQGFIQQVDSARSYLVGGCNGMVGKGFNISLQQAVDEEASGSTKEEGHFTDTESRVGLMKDLFVEGKGPVAYLLDMQCINRGKYYGKSDVTFEDDRLMLHCSKRGFKGNVDIKRPLRFHSAVIETVQTAVKFNSRLQKAFAAVFCEAMTFKKDRQLAMEMYLRIMTSPLETLEAGLFPLTADEKKQREAAREAEKPKDESEGESDDSGGSNDSDDSNDSNDSKDSDDSRDSRDSPKKGRK